MFPRYATLAVLLASAVLRLRGYTFTGSHWAYSPVTMELQLGTPSSPLSDGSADWNAVAENALSIWNRELGRLQFAWNPNSSAPQAEGNGYNNVFFASSVYGQAWGTGVLAITLTYTSGGTSTAECDVLFNRNLQWDSYRGTLRYPAFDFRRVALHEFGHVVGLDHPDQAGQSVVAIMNSVIGDLDNLAADDIAGGQALYGPNTATAPAITTQPVSQTVNTGASFTLSVVANGSSPLSYQWYRDNVAIAGAIAATYTVNTATANNAGTYTVRVGSGALGVMSDAVTVTVDSAPAIAAAPAGGTVSDGGRITLSVTASGSPAPTYQWQKNGLNIAGATQSTFVIGAASPADSGTYSVVVTNAAGSVTTVPVLVTVNYSQLVNLSTRGYIPSGGQMIAGFVLAGSGDKPLVIRGVGPALDSYGVADPLADPRLAVIAQSTAQTLAVNSGWNTSPSLSSSTFQSVGAFPLPAGSADAASEVQLPPGSYTSTISSSSGADGGVALAEVYDANASSVRNRLVNLSTLGFTATGDRVLVAGFTIQGNATKHVLVRAIGPTLAQYGVANPLPNPRLDVYPLGQSTSIAGNDDWGGAAGLSAAFTAAGAFPLPANSLDAAAILALSPGGYTVVVTGVGGTTGYALVEIYDLDP